jgi:hypothetical protein
VTLWSAVLDGELYGSLLFSSQTQPKYVFPRRMQSLHVVTLTASQLSVAFKHSALDHRFRTLSVFAAASFASILVSWPAGLIDR